MIRSVSDVHHLVCDLCGTESDKNAETASLAEHNASEGGWLLWYSRHICPKCALEAVELWLRFRRPI